MKRKQMSSRCLQKLSLAIDLFCMQRELLLNDNSKPHFVKTATSCSDAKCCGYHQKKMSSI